MRDYLRDSETHLLTTWPVVTEAWHLLAPSQRLTLVRWIKSGGATIAPFDDETGNQLIDWLEKYRDLPMDLADASLVILAERLGLDQVLTLDRRDFDVYRLSGGRKFEQVLGRSGAM